MRELSTVPTGDAKKITLSAVHEAAHAVVGICLKLPIMGTDIEEKAAPDQEHPEGRISGNTFCDDEEAAKMGLFKEMVVMSFAGIAAERRILATVGEQPSKDTDCWSDRRTAEEWACKHLGIIGQKRFRRVLRDYEQRAVGCDFGCCRKVDGEGKTYSA